MFCFVGGCVLFVLGLEDGDDLKKSFVKNIKR